MTPDEGQHPEARLAGAQADARGGRANGDPGRAIRWGRVVDIRDGRTVIATYAHGLLRGPLAGEPKPPAIGPQLEAFRDVGLDAILMSPGMLRTNARHLSGRCSPGIVVCLDWTNAFRDRQTALGFDEGRSSPIGTVDDALRWGADAVLTYLFIGSSDPAVEADAMRYNAAISRACERLGMVRIIETMARGARVAENEATRPEYVALHCRIASELGCDLIKTEWTGSVETFRSVAETTPVPIVVAGGPRADSVVEALRLAQDGIAAGAAGVVFGRNLVQAADPVATADALRRVVHEGASAEDAAAQAGLR